MCVNTKRKLFNLKVINNDLKITLLKNLTIFSCIFAAYNYLTVGRKD